MSSNIHLFRVPLVAKVLFSVVIGVVCSFYDFFPDIPFSLIFYTVIAFALFFVSRITRKDKLNLVFNIGLLLLFVCIGGQLGNWNKSNLNKQYFGNVRSDWDSVYQLRLSEPVIEKENSVRCIVSVEKIDTTNVVGDALLYLEKSKKSLALEYGDILLIKGGFKSIRSNGNPKEFDYARYLKIHDVYHQGYVKEGSWLRAGNNADWFYTSVYSIRSNLEEKLEEASLSDESLKVAKALILGKKESLDRELLRTFSSAGAMHVLAVSGLHVGIIMLLFSAILFPVKRLRKGKAIFVVLLLVIIWLYAFITGMSSSVLRATVMFSFVILGKELERDTSIYQSILVSAFVLIIVEPFVIFQVGFQLSYLAVLGIVFLQPKIYRLLYVRWFLVDKVWQITSVSIAAQIATFPLGLYYFHQFPNFFFISNLIVIPMAFAILLVGIFYFFVCWIPFLSGVIAELLNGLITVLNYGVKWIEELPYSIYWGVSIEWFEVFWMYFLLILFSAGFVKKSVKLFKYALFGVVSLLLFNVSEQKWQSMSNELVIYNVNKTNAVDIFYGRENMFIADSSLISDEEKLMFHVKHNWYYRTGAEEPSAFLPLRNESILRFGDKQMFMLSDNWLRTNQEKFYETDFVYLHNLSRISDRMLSSLLRTSDKVIIGPNVRYAVLEKVRDTLPEEKVHELKTNGAFHCSFN